MELNNRKKYYELADITYLARELNIEKIKELINACKK
jgi:hypothetical protein